MGKFSVSTVSELDPVKEEFVSFGSWVMLWMLLLHTLPTQPCHQQLWACRDNSPGSVFNSLAFIYIQIRG